MTRYLAFFVVLSLVTNAQAQDDKKKIAEASIRTAEMVVKLAKDRMEAAEKKVSDAQAKLDTAIENAAKARADVLKAKLAEERDEAPRSAAIAKAKEDAALLKPVYEKKWASLQYAKAALDARATYATIDRYDEVLQDFKKIEAPYKEAEKFLKDIDCPTAKKKEKVDGIGKLLDEEIAARRDTLRRAEEERTREQQAFLQSLETYQSAQRLLAHSIFPAEELRGLLTTLTERITTLETDLPKAKDVATLKTRLESFRKDAMIELGVLKEGVNGNTQAIAKFHAETMKLRADVTRLIGEFAALKIASKETAQNTALALDAISLVKEKIELTHSELSKMRSDLAALLALERGRPAPPPGPYYRMVIDACGRWSWQQVWPR